MPIRIDNELPAKQSLEIENIFVMSNKRADTQDIRPLHIIILNLMPTKIDTETQLLRLLSNTPLQVNVDFLQVSSHTAKHTSKSHMDKFYYTFDQIKDRKYDGMIITGAPVEQMPFEEVDYWDELCRIMDWTKTNVYSTFHICWGAQAGLYYRYGIPKHPLSKKMFGVFPHRSLDVTHPLMRGLDDVFYIPHSRHTEILRQDIACRSWHTVILPVSVCCPIWSAATSSLPGTVNTTEIHWPKNIFVTRAKDWTLTGPTTTFPTMMRTWCPWSAGKVQPA